MAGISNIIGAYNINHKRVSSKLSFEIGQVFTAKIISASEMNKELILKLLDGWQFSAKLENPLLDIPEGLAKFQVEGDRDGKLQIRLINNGEDKQEIVKDSLEELLSESNLDVAKEDYNILKKMLKHEIPLTKENVSKVKTLVNFREKLFKNDAEADSFITKYINSKNIDINSERGKEIKQTLKIFFNELKNISEDELLTMIENSIDINEDNIKSFIKIFRNESSIYKQIKNIDNEINFQKVFNDASNEVKSEGNIVGEQPILERQSNSIMKAEGNVNSNSDAVISTERAEKEAKAEVKEVKADIDTTIGKAEEKTKSDAAVKEQRPEAVESKTSLTKLNKNTLELEVKEQLSAKTEEMKETIKNILTESKSRNSEGYGKLLQVLKENINEFKVFNSIGNHYYYLDVPINITRDEYQCKLLIKDDRKSGKKVDSKNVSLVVSVKTPKIGIVDAYVKVRDKNMNVDIKCEDQWVKILSEGKGIIVKELSSLGYNVFFNVDKKIIEANLVNCREFFDDNELGSINIKV